MDELDEFNINAATAYMVVCKPIFVSNPTEVKQG